MRANCGISPSSAVSAGQVQSSHNLTWHNLIPEDTLQGPHIPMLSCSWPQLTPVYYRLMPQTNRNIHQHTQRLWRPRNSVHGDEALYKKIEYTCCSIISRVWEWNKHAINYWHHGIRCQNKLGLNHQFSGWFSFILYPTFIHSNIKSNIKMNSSSTVWWIT